MIGIVFLQNIALIQPLGCFDPIVQWDTCTGDREHLRMGMVKDISCGDDRKHLRVGMRDTISGWG